MPYCEVCKDHYPEGTVACPKDERELVDELPFQTIDAVNTTWVEIASAGTENEARILKGFLDAEGIPAQVESLKFTMEPVNLGRMGEIRLYVPAEHEQTAIELLEARDEDYESMEDDESILTDEGPATIADDSETAGEGEEK